MSIERVADDGVIFLIVSGDVDVESAPALRQAGIEALSDFVGTVRIDLAAVTFLDSMGVSALLAIRNAADATRHTLILESPSRPVLRVLELTKLTQSFQIK